MFKVPRRVVGPLLIVVLLLQGLASPAQAAGSVVKGVWLSIDFDGSTQLLILSSGSEPSVVYEDFFASVCADNGVASTRWVAAGQCDVGDQTMAVTFHKTGCGVFGMGGYQEVFAYDAAADALTDSFGSSGVASRGAGQPALHSADVRAVRWTRDSLSGPGGRSRRLLRDRRELEPAGLSTRRPAGAGPTSDRIGFGQVRRLAPGDSAKVQTS